MPVEVTKYLCQFKCFHKAVNDKIKMKHHENVCWNNPENKTCKTCKSQISFTENDDEYRPYPVRSCKIKELADFFDTFADRLRPTPHTMKIRPIYNCQYHNQEPDEKIEAFVDELTNEFGTNEAGTYHFPYYIPSLEKQKVTELPF